MNGLKQRLTRTHPTGFSLLEVLVGLIILAIGLLGLAGMQMVSLRQNNDAYLRSQATLQAYDILDRMRANRRYALDGEYVIDYGEQPDTGLPDQVYEDLNLWKSSLSATLPGPGDGAVEVTNGTIVTISIQWHETTGQNATQSGTWQEFTTQSEL
jgi:type IV pilus assembly protein PilV